MEPILGAAVVVGLLLITGARARDEAIDSAWLRAARELGLEFERGSPFSGRKLHGVIDGLATSVHVDLQRRGEQSRHTTVYRVAFHQGLQFRLDLRRESFTSSVRKLLGASDIIVGDPEFDEAVVVSASDPKRLQALLTPQRRARILKFMRRYPSAHLTDQAIATRTDKLERDPAVIVETVRGMIEIGQLLGTAVEPTSGAPEVAPTKRAPAKKARPASPKAQAAPKRPASPKPPVSPEPQAAPPEPAVDDAASILLPVATVCEALFEGQSSSQQTSEVFEKRFKGAEVRWTGKLLWVDAAAFDLVFGFQPVARAVLEVCGGVTAGLSGGRAVHALVRLRGAEAEALRALVGQGLTFTGKLVACDAFARNLYVEDGQIADN